ncbi:glycosyltransferase family 4 protein [Natronoglycomyces albus]|uniref:Glycosyltransferase family 4 protein n=1 Tax=Natronoglycomyces albus TaxID=2811108 RepID=A0A895XN71_9ACTN|nr:glycosyltransferase family 4 protein [Natronoglycomyces albus]QSB03916.1 glycosyltransferase family 4 protein [Natronoglycomyces albus]
MSGRRIAFVLGPSTGGIGTHVASIAGGFAQRGDRVTVVAPAEVEDRFGFTDKGARFVAAPISNKPGPGLGLAWKATRKALSGISGRGVDIVHAHGLTGGLTALLARPATSSLLCTWHNQLITEGLKRTVSNSAEKRLARSVDIALAASSDLQAHLISLGARDARLAPVAAPDRRAAGSPTAVAEELDLQGRPLIVSVGRLHQQKDYDTLVNAASAWSKMEPSPVVAIAGDGPERERLQGLIDSAGVDVRLLGHRSDVANLLAAATLAVVTSQWEARQLFAQEVLQAGIPLVATRTGGIPELVGDAATLFEVGDVEGLSEAVATLLGDESLRQERSKAGTAQAATWPDEAATIDQLDAIYRELVGR